MKKSFVLFFIVCLCAGITGQDPSAKSIWVSGDSVSLSLAAPNATSVQLICEGLTTEPEDTFDLTLSGGRWRFSRGDILPGFYYYRFVVDGTSVYDIDQPRRFYHDNCWKNAFEIVDASDPFYEMGEGPFGNFNQVIYPSSIAGGHKRCVVYTPPGYDDQPEILYRVLYLISDSSDSEFAWVYQGKINAILDNAQQEGLIDPLLVVLCQSDRETAGMLSDSSIIHETVPHIDSLFRTVPDAEGRFVAGIRSGGVKAVRIYTGNHEMFSGLGIFSFPVYTTSENLPDFSVHPVPETFIVGAGLQDVNFDEVEAFHQSLSVAGIDHTWITYPGNHNWLVWRKLLLDMLTNME